MHLTVRYLNAVSSTQTEALAAVRLGDTAIHAVRAGYQTAGRGRWGKRWLGAPNESLLISYILWELPLPDPHWQLGVVMALAVCEVAETETNAAVRPLLRWPNDITLDGRKLGGVLMETEKAPSGANVGIIGVGLNLNATVFDEEIAHTATSLRQATSATWDVERFSHAIWDRFHSLRATVARSPDQLGKIWSRRDGTAGKRYVSPDGSRQGTAIEVDERGMLVVKWDDGEVTSMPAACAIY